MDCIVDATGASGRQTACEMVVAPRNYCFCRRQRLLKLLRNTASGIAGVKRAPHSTHNVSNITVSSARLSYKFSQA